MNGPTSQNSTRHSCYICTSSRHDIFQRRLIGPSALELRSHIWAYVFEEALSIHVVRKPTYSGFGDIYLFHPRCGNTQASPPKNFLASTLVSHQIRSEALAYLGSLLFDFHDDIEILSILTNTGIKAHLKFVHIDFIEDRYAYSTLPSLFLSTFISSLLPNLKLLHITLIPGIPDINNDHADYHFGPQATGLLGTLHEMRATVQLSLKWNDDCEYFEKEYLEKGGWTCVGEVGFPPQSVCRMRCPKDLSTVE